MKGYANKNLGSCTCTQCRQLLDGRLQWRFRGDVLLRHPFSRSSVHRNHLFEPPLDQPTVGSSMLVLKTPNSKHKHLTMR